MTRPIKTLQWMGIFTIVIIIGTLLLAKPLYAAYSSNVAFNTVILIVFIIGIVINFRQVVLLYPEIDWLESYQADPRTADADQSRLLSSMARMLSGKDDLVMSTTSMRTILDSIRTRLEDSRDLSRYLIGVLIFLGLLGTFWGLMATVSSVGTLISDMSVEADDGATIFANLKAGLSGPLSGMGVAFSSSLFGLAGSLVVGFLDLQAGHALNRFANELEEWLSSSTRISSGLIGEEGGAGNAPAYVHALLEKTADALEKMQRTGVDGDRQRENLAKQIGDMGNTFDQFNSLLTTQNDQLDKLNQMQSEIASLLQTAAKQDQGTANEALREELRLMTKTIANALSERGNS